MRTILITVALVGMVGAAGAQQPDQIYKVGEGITPPRIVKDVHPKYTSGAMKAGVQGTVIVEAVVLRSGRIGDVKVTRSLDTKHGLDQEAIKAVKAWRFKPGTKDGKPVPVRVDIELTFTLRSTPR